MYEAILIGLICAVASGTVVFISIWWAFYEGMRQA